MTLRSYWRFLVVVWQFFPLVLAYVRDRRRFVLFGRAREVSADQRRRRAATLLDSLLTLGPTFIKLGQLLSTRPDILPPEYIDEFTQLQDRVPPADWRDARTVIETELGDVESTFDEFDTDAVSGASLGQVYVARSDGEPVAVKVRRPGVEQLVEADLRVIRWTLPVVRRFVDESRSFSLETLADEFARTIRQEMDYEREARMLTEIRGNFAEDRSVRMPEVIDSLSTRRVLTMEYVSGTKITDVEALEAAGVDRSGLAERLQRAYMQMIIEDGIFHADPHPGNLAVQDDGTLVFYDFGMSGFVDPFVQDRIVDFYASIARKDISAILDTLVEMGTLSPDADREVMGEVMELAIQDARGQDIEQYRVQQLVQQVEDTLYEFPLRLPSDLALVLRVATVVEGVCVTLDPDFDFIAVATAFLREQGHLEAGIRDHIRDRVGDSREAVEATVRIPAKLDAALDRVENDSLTVRAELQDPNQHIDRLARRVVLGIFVAAGFLATTALALFEAPLPAAGTGLLTVVLLAFLYRSFRTPRGIRAHPQFTRHRLRQRGDGADGATGFGDPGGVTGFGEPNEVTGFGETDTAPAEKTRRHIPVEEDSVTRDDEVQAGGGGDGETETDEKDDTVERPEE